MLGVGIFAGSIIRTWDVVHAGVAHTLRLHHHTMGGTRYLQLDGAEVHKSRGSTTVVSLTAAGHVLQFRIGTDGPVGFVKILPFGATGFSYHCFLNDARVPERGEAVTTKKLAAPFVNITLPATEVHRDSTGEPVTFYRMDIMSETRGKSCIYRFSDFFRLNESLKAAFKGSPILAMLPEFPQRSLKLLANHTDGAFITARRKALQAYMSTLARLDIMRSNNDFLRFLGLSASEGVIRERREVVVAFPAGPMGLTLKPTNRVNAPAEVVGFKPLADGTPGPAQRSGQLHIGDVLTAVDGHSVIHMTYGDAIAHIKARARPVHLHFLTMAATDGDDEAKTAGAGAAAASAKVPPSQSTAAVTSTKKSPPPVAAASPTEASPAAASSPAGSNPQSPSPLRKNAPPIVPLTPLRRQSEPSSPADLFADDR